MSASPLWRLAASLLVAAALLAALFVWGGVGFADFAAALGRLDVGVWALAFALHAGIYVLRAWRFRLLVPPPARPAFGPTLAVSAAHNLASYVLPAKTGEATLVLYLKGYAGVPAAAGLASLVVSRLFDLAVLCAAVAAALAVTAERVTALGEPLPLIAALAALAVALAAACLRPQALPSLTGWLLERLRLQRVAAGRAVLSRLERIGSALRATSGARTQLACLALTAGQWALVFAFYAVLARGTGLPSDIGYAEAMFGSSLAVLFNLLPVNGFAGFGTQEAGWKIGFVLLGVEPELALATGLAVHLVQLADVVLLGLAGHAALGLGRSARSAGAGGP